MWIALIIVGLILLVLGWFLPMPYPGKQLLVAGGTICVVIGLILLILAALAVHYDDHPTVGSPPSTVLLV